MKDLLEPAFQPIVDLTTGRVEYYEALARIRQDPTNSGHVKLIELAEQHHFIHRVDLAILDLAADAAALEGQRIGVNFSPLTIEDNFQQAIAQLDQLRPVREAVTVEITETVPVRDRQKVAYFIEAVRGMGCRVALDDFGTGYNHLTEDLVRFLRPDYLKLDGSILARAEQLGDYQCLSQAVALAQDIGAHVIAEVVDSEEKVELLMTYGVRYGQGWAFGRPVRSAFLPVTTATRESLMARKHVERDSAAYAVQYAEEMPMK